MNRRIWVPGGRTNGKAGGGRYVPLSELVREYLPDEPQKPFYGHPGPDTVPWGLWMALACVVGILVCYGMLCFAGVVR